FESPLLFLSSLEALVQKTSTKLVQVNGQQKNEGPPPGWNGPAPGSGCEVYISRIPWDVYEDRLIPLFQVVAPLYRFLMMNFSGQNRGFPQVAGRHAPGGAPQHREMAAVPGGAAHQREVGAVAAGGLSEGVKFVTLKAARDAKSIASVVLYASRCAVSMAKKVLCDVQYLAGVTLSVTGMAHILLGSSPGAMQEEVCHIAAEHVLTSLKA
uniref:Uncharacterized protein n=1 Tax=Scleropages formosus TaxID=113540 RepID=A0A8C9WLF7_SCLFO